MVNKLNPAQLEDDKAFDISNADVVVFYIRLLYQGKSDIEPFPPEPQHQLRSIVTYFATAL